MAWLGPGLAWPVLKAWDLVWSVLGWLGLGWLSLYVGWTGFGRRGLRLRLATCGPSLTNAGLGPSCRGLEFGSPGPSLRGPCLRWPGPDLG
jgi:hypothetical protein